jgi:diguanylate cyclase (GGDEF)-like protein
MIARATRTARAARSRRAADAGVRIGSGESAAEFRAHAARAKSSLPRLSLRFAIYTAVGFSFAAAMIVLFVRSYTMEQAEASVKRHSRVVARATLAEELRLNDFSRPVSATRQAELDRIFRGRILADGIVEAALVNRNGIVTYAADHSLIGRPARQADELRRTFESRALRSRIAERERARPNGSQKVMDVFIPVRFQRGNQAGVFVLSHDWEPILKSARKAYLPIAGVLELVLLALYASFFPVLRRVTRRLRRQLDETEHQALHDSLTGLPNRLLFRDRVEQALLRAQRSGEGVAVMLIDLDRFKEVNDTLGHESGDLLLRELGGRLASVLRSSDTFARLGGDEFGVVAPGAEEATLVQVVERILAAIERPFILGGLELEVGASIGIALHPRDADDVATLVKRADIAMYVAKNSRSRYTFYEPERDESDANRLTIVSGLRAGIERDELVLHYQPKFDLTTGQIESAEALVRWEHPTRGLLQPAEFLATAAETGLMPSLTRWVLDSALAECRTWSERGRRLPVAVNVDVRSLLDDSFADEVALALTRAGVEPELLELEMTEGTVMTEPEAVAGVAVRLRELGVKLALDDFGSGFSSLSYLQRLPFSELKIDGSFIAPLASDRTVKPIVRSIISLGRNLRLRVVAEGIETAEVLRAVRATKCPFGQGYELAVPLPADELWDRLGQQSGDRAVAAA